jgi:hypothetical protein
VSDRWLTASPSLGARCSIATPVRRERLTLSLKNALAETAIGRVISDLAPELTRLLAACERLAGGGCRGGSCARRDRDR